jgi:formamidopyrimidine-DNA glycosylase
MAEGPQIKLRTEWLHRKLAGREVLACETGRPRLIESVSGLVGSRVVRAFCKGKHSFIEFDNGSIIHSRLLMRGTWRELGGRLLFLPPGAWLGIYVGPYTICNLNGQVLSVVGAEEVSQIMATLGPDVMEEPFPEEAVMKALKASKLPISEALLDQSVVCGLGNIAKSEALHVAAVNPRIHADRLDDRSLTELARASARVCWDSYNAGGRWRCRVYRRRGQSCERCGRAIQMLRQKPSRRSTYYCPRCQGATHRTGYSV